MLIDFKYKNMNVKIDLLKKKKMGNFNVFSGFYYSSYIILIYYNNYRLINS